MTANGYTTSYTVDRSPEDVFHAINNVRGWWSGDIDGRTDVLGAEFTYRYQDVHRSTQKITELVPGRKVVWRVLDAEINFVKDKDEWNGTDVVFEITRKDGKTELRFTHVGLVPAVECYGKCAGAWGFYINESLRSLIATGQGDPNEKESMLSLTGKNVVVIGGSRGVGRRIVESAARHGARVLAVARQQGSLREVAQEIPGAEILALDATDEEAPAKVFDVLQPDILVLCGGAMPPAAPIYQQSWREFAVNWDVDVKIAFHFLKAALSRPLPAGSSVVLISSGAALAGSPNSGGYAGAKRTQLFLANYSQKESDRLGLGLRFLALAPRMMPDTELGKHAIAGYARYLGISESDFIKGMASPPSPSDVAAGVIELVTNPDGRKESVFVVSGKGLEAASL